MKCWPLPHPGYRHLNEVITTLAAHPSAHVGPARRGRKAKQDAVMDLVLDGKLFSAYRVDEQTTSVKMSEAMLGTPSSIVNPVATFKPWWNPTASRRAPSLPRGARRRCHRWGCHPICVIPRSGETWRWPI